MPKIYRGIIVLISIVGSVGIFLLFLWAFEGEKENGLQKVSEREPLAQQIQKQEEMVSMSEETEKTKASIVFGGDVMLDRYIRGIAERDGYSTLLEGETDILLESDGVVINLEGPITENPSISMGSPIGSRNNYYFTFSPESVDFLLENNMTIAHVGNNHIYNFDKEGLESTQKYLENAGIGYFGALEDLPERYVLRQTINDIDISLVSHNEFSKVRPEKIRELILEERRWADFVVVYAHWGVEYDTTPTQTQREIAYSYIESGADILIGSHPHVVQEIQEHQGKKIYYSLGNFVFDQYFSEGVKNGLLLKVTFPSEGELHIEEIPVTLSPSGKTHIGNIK